MVPQAFAKSAGAHILQNPVIVVSAVLSDRMRVPYNDRRVFDKRQQLERQPKPTVLFFALLRLVPDAVRALRSDAQCASLQLLLQHTCASSQYKRGAQK